MALSQPQARSRVCCHARTHCRQRCATDLQADRGRPAARGARAESPAPGRQQTLLQCSRRYQCGCASSSRAHSNSKRAPEARRPRSGPGAAAAAAARQLLWPHASGGMCPPPRQLATLRVTHAAGRRGAADGQLAAGGLEAPALALGLELGLGAGCCSGATWRQPVARGNIGTAACAPRQRLSAETRACASVGRVHNAGHVAPRSTRWPRGAPPVEAGVRPAACTCR
jgi:hypothetical protein